MIIRVNVVVYEEAHHNVITRQNTEVIYLKLGDYHNPFNVGYVLLHFIRNDGR